MSILVKTDEFGDKQARWNNRFGWTMYLVNWEAKAWKTYITYRLRNR